MSGTPRVANASALLLVVFSTLLLTTARPAQAQTETVLYNFCSQPNCSDGAYASSRLTSDGAGNFYGTTISGGMWGYGTVFEVSPDGHGGWIETVLYSFKGGMDGCYPYFSYVVFDRAGNLYGTTGFGGAFGFGTVFELSPVGTNWTETVAYSFDGPTSPDGGLVMDPAGNLYGSTERGVFELSLSGGNWTFQVISRLEFVDPVGVTMDASGNIFGTTNNNANKGMVFELSPNGQGGWNSTVIHTFADNQELESPPVLDHAGNLYGTTEYGGSKKQGTVYKLSPGVNGKWKAKILHPFKGGNDGAQPFAGIVFDAAGNIYGTTLAGGAYGYGTVFELAAVGKNSYSYKEKVLWSFNGADGSAPYGSPVLDNLGNLYGTTYSGVSSGSGVVFQVTP
jgi:uncharacterized repeat protein (TIGR03803 family)